MTDTDARLERVAHQHTGPLGGVLRWWLENRSSYEAGKGDERPLTGYLLAATTYGTAVLGVVGVLTARRTRAALPTPGELGLLAVATAMTSRTIAKDAVTSPLRSPFATFEEAGAPSEVNESPRDGSVRHAVGELITCPFCLAQWVATAYLAGHAAAPRATRWVASTMAVVAAADVLQHSYGILQAASEG